MKRRGKLLFAAGVICMMGGFLFVMLFGFTPLKQGLQDRLVFDSFEELGYRVTSVQEHENGRIISLTSLDGGRPTQEELDEVFLEAQRRGGKKLVNILKVGSWIGTVSGLVLMTSGYVLQILPETHRGENEQKQEETHTQGYSSKYSTNRASSARLLRHGATRKTPGEQSSKLGRGDWYHSRETPPREGSGRAAKRA